MVRLSFATLTRKIAEANADPDCLLLLQVEDKLDYEDLDFPTQGLANYLSGEGLLKSVGKSLRTDKHKLRNLWSKGCYFDQWKEEYLRNRHEWRRRFKLPLTCGLLIAFSYISDYVMDAFLDIISS